jgi:hypothetical protein
MLVPSFLNAQGIKVADGLTIDGQIRERTEFDGRDFNSDTDLIERSYLRTRLGLKFTRIENTKIYLQFQDSRNLGTNSGGLTNDDNLGVHQAYIKFMIPGMEGGWLQLGRFEAKYGRERVIGAVGWSNVGRTFDGLRFGYDGGFLSFDMFLLKIVERGFGTPARAGDHHLYGLYTRWLKNHLHVFGLLDYDHQESFPGSDEPSLARYTVGTYYHRTTRSGFDVALDLAYQGGEFDRINVDKISAYMIATEMGYTFINSDAKPRFAAGVDITSGDDGTDASELNTYNNLYYTGHAFRGYMDLFVENPFAGLLDIFGRMSLTPTDKWWFGFDFHYFRTMEEYFILTEPIGDNTSNAVGSEIDFTTKYNIYENLDAQGGLSIFFPSDDWQGDDSDTGTWFYFMLTAGL